MELPDSIRKIVEKGVADLRPTRVVLFGSRARGKADATSDFDLAFLGVEDVGRWSSFVAYVLEDAPTIWSIDVVRFEEAPPELQQEIRRDAVDLYVAA